MSKFLKTSARNLLIKSMFFLEHSFEQKRFFESARPVKVHEQIWQTNFDLIDISKLNIQWDSSHSKLSFDLL